MARGTDPGSSRTRCPEAKIDISGVFIPTATPFDSTTGDVDPGALKENVGRWLQTGVAGFVVGGSTGEAVLLDEDERVRIWEAVREAAPADRCLIAGTGGESLRATLRMSRKAADLGYDALLVQPPAFYKGAMTDDVVRDHYRTVADAVEVPVIIYQVPTRFSTLDFTTGLIAELSSHPNIIGIKDSRGKLDLVGELVTQTQEGFQVLVGSGSLLYGSLEIGAVGGILGVANIAAGDCADIHALFAQGDPAGAGAMQERVAPLHNAIIGGMGVPGVKAALDLLGYRGGSPRPPLRPLPQAKREEVAALLAGAGLAAA
ncbi:MAG: dihydrodipicolinate synthase family protein [Gemmatimonadota bacterium]|nr:dihydrodipicolinate synthase family protein [Gemmatimonadota bacterium]